MANLTEYWSNSIRVNMKLKEKQQTMIVEQKEVSEENMTLNFSEKDCLNFNLK